MFLMVLGGRVTILGGDYLGKKESCLQSPLCMNLVLNINESSFYMRLSYNISIKQILLRNSKVGEWEGVVYKNEQTLTSPVTRKDSYEKITEAVGVGSDFHIGLLKSWGGNYFIPERSGESAPSGLVETKLGLEWEGPDSAPGCKWVAG